MIIRREKKPNLGMFPMDKRYRHGFDRRMQRVFAEHFHLQINTLTKNQYQLRKLTMKMLRYLGCLWEKMRLPWIFRSREKFECKGMERKENRYEYEMLLLWFWLQVYIEMKINDALWLVMKTAMVWVCIYLKTCVSYFLSITFFT